jgi:hypothetical protein
MANITNLAKKIKAIRKDEMIEIPQQQVQGLLPVINSLTAKLTREYQQGNLIITRTA